MTPTATQAQHWDGREELINSHRKDLQENTLKVWFGENFANFIWILINKLLRGNPSAIM